MQRSTDEPTPDWQEVKDVFAGALDRPASDRDAFVASRCGGNPVLEGSVRELLAALEEAPDFLESRELVDRTALAALADPRLAALLFRKDVE